MTDALVEAVARAVQTVACNSGKGSMLLDEFGGYGDDEDFVILATAALQAIEAAGYRVVPVEATEGMAHAGAEADDGSQHHYLAAYMSVWSAMLSAAPRVGEG